MMEQTASIVAYMDRLTAFGLLAVSLMLLFYALERRSASFVLAFTGACVMDQYTDSSRAPGHSG